MAELVDALASGASSRKGVEVRVFFWAPILFSALPNFPQISGFDRPLPHGFGRRGAIWSQPCCRLQGSGPSTFNRHLKDAFGRWEKHGKASHLPPASSRAKTRDPVTGSGGSFFGSECTGPRDKAGVIGEWVWPGWAPHECRFSPGSGPVNLTLATQPASPIRCIASG